MERNYKYYYSFYVLITGNLTYFCAHAAGVLPQKLFT
jgi:hypothetical protein